MTRMPIVVLGLFAVCLPPGCRRETDPPPRFMGQGSGYGIPVRVLDRAGDDSIIASVPPDEEPLPDHHTETVAPDETAAPDEPAEGMTSETSAEPSEKVSVSDDEELDDEEASEEPGPAAEERKERPREAVDEVYSGPGMLRAR